MRNPKCKDSNKKINVFTHILGDGRGKKERKSKMRKIEGVWEGTDDECVGKRRRRMSE